MVEKKVHALSLLAPYGITTVSLSVLFLDVDLWVWYPELRFIVLEEKEPDLRRVSTVAV